VRRLHAVQSDAAPATPHGASGEAPRSTSYAEKLKQKLARNLDLGWPELLEKGVRFLHSTALTRFHLRHLGAVGVGVRVTGLAPVVERPSGSIRLGDDVVLFAPTTPIYFGVQPGAVLSLGDECFVNNGVWFGCTERISVGKGVLIGPGVRILDNDFHGALDRRRQPPARPVTIEDDVWVASGATILAGVTVGRGAIIGADALVRRDVAPFTLVAGNPARFIRTVDSTRFVDRRARRARSG
jgi:acetyltransferase-like isoleucine patch superfamily enzyme